MGAVTLLDRLAAIDPRAVVERLSRDPPQRILARAARVAVQSGFGSMIGDPLAMGQIALQRGLGVRSLHALHAAGSPGRVAVIDRHRQLDYAGLDAEIDAAANALRADGARRGAPVGLLMENRCEYVALWMALTRLGIASAHLGTSATAAELAPILERSGIERVLVSEATRDTAQQVATDHPQLGLRLIDVSQQPAPGLASYHQLIAQQRGRATPTRDTEGDAASVVFTSGTTGRPKGAVRDLQSLGVMDLLRILEFLPLRVGERHLVVSPLYHSGAQAFTLLCSALGATLVLVDRFDAESVLDTLHHQRIESTFMVPTMLRRVLDLPAELHARRPASTVRAIVSGAAPFPVGLRHRAIERFGADAIFDFYGATELGWVTLATGHDMLEKPGTLGRPLGGQEVRVVDEDGRSVADGEVGKIYTRSHQHMRGYLRDEAATSEIKDGGWVTVDDLGYLDPDGHLFLTGRARDMVISGGVNVYPVEVENVLSQHPQIRDVAVIGLPHADWGEQLTAVVVAEEGFSAEAIDGWIRERLAKAKRPRRWEHVDVLPRNPTGKVLKRALRERYADGSSDAGSAAGAS